jgi:hypothetical protein
MGTREYNDRFVPSGTFCSPASVFKSSPYGNETAVITAKDLEAGDVQYVNTGRVSLPHPLSALHQASTPID